MFNNKNKNSNTNIVLLTQPLLSFVVVYFAIN